jgi:hypothetical protein
MSVRLNNRWTWVQFNGNHSFRKMYSVFIDNMKIEDSRTTKMKWKDMSRGVWHVELSRGKMMLWVNGNQGMRVQRNHRMEIKSSRQGMKVTIGSRGINGSNDGNHWINGWNWGDNRKERKIQATSRKWVLEWWWKRIKSVQRSKMKEVDGKWDRWQCWVEWDSMMSKIEAKWTQ